jgi:hypothetical protein
MAHGPCHRTARRRASSQLPGTGRAGTACTTAACPAPGRPERTHRRAARDPGLAPRRCATTGPARPWTGMPPTSSPPTCWGRPLGLATSATGAHPPGRSRPGGSSPGRADITEREAKAAHEPPIWCVSAFWMACGPACRTGQYGRCLDAAAGHVRSGRSRSYRAATPWRAWYAWPARFPGGLCAAEGVDGCQCCHLLPVGGPDRTPALRRATLMAPAWTTSSTHKMTGRMT